MKFILFFFIFYFIMIAMIIAMPLFLSFVCIATIVFILYKIYEIFYFKSDKFLSIKEEIKDYISDCNELNRHIEELKNTYAEFNQTDYGNANFIDNSRYQYKRKELSKFIKSQYTYNCSLTVCRNAQQQPFKYLCKYFNISINEDTLNEFETVFNNFSAAEQGKKLIKNKKYVILSGINNRIPFLIRTFSKKKLDKKLGFEEVDFKTVYFPKYTFRYISGGGNSSMKVDILLDLNNLERFINYLSENIKWRKSVAGQRALMTSSLREKIKKRDHFTCMQCGNSIEKEPNLLLEIDHIVPVSKGGLTAEDNLQTLCWKCNRKKGSKLQENNIKKQIKIANATE